MPSRLEPTAAALMLGSAAACGASASGTGTGTRHRPEGTAATRLRARRRAQGGAVIIEFAFVSLLLYLIVSVTIEFGRIFFSAQVLHDAANVGARELGSTPLPASYTWDQAMADPQVRARIYDPDWLVIDLDNIPGGQTLDDFYGSLPVINQMLRPIMIYEERDGLRLLRYPGALMDDPGNPNTGLTVGILKIEGRDANGHETARWIPVVEEIKNPDFPGASPFSRNTPPGMPQRGLVALRINYPYQAAMLSGYMRKGAAPTTNNIANIIQADDAQVIILNPADAPGLERIDTREAHPYAGKMGLGRHYSQTKVVRPFRKLISTQMLVPREVYE